MSEPHRVRRATLAVSLGLALLPIAVVGQTVRGRAVERESRAPVSGALLELRTQTGEVAATTMTDEGGRYVLRAPHPGTYRIHAERIGLEDWTSAPLELEAGRNVTRTLSLPAHPVALQSLSVEAKSPCRRLSAQGADTRLVWAEVHKALSLTVLSRSPGVHAYVIRSFDRLVDPRTRKVLSDTSSVDTTWTMRPFAAESPDTLVKRGFVTGDSLGSRWFHGLDAAVLISKPFLRTHCLALVPSRQEHGERWLGLHFQPVPGRTVSDVSGVLWVEATKDELRELDFHFVHIEGPGAGRLGGQVRFRRLSTGGWIVSRWKLDLPQIGSEEVRLGGARREILSLAAIHEHGKEVVGMLAEDGGGAAAGGSPRASGQPAAGASAAAPSGGPAADALSTLIGTVVSEATGRPVAGATVRLGGGLRVTGADGRFEWIGIAPGRQILQVEASGYRRLSDTIELRPATAAHDTARLSPVAKGP